MVLSTEYKIKFLMIFNHIAFGLGLFYADLISWQIPVFLISASSLITIHSAGLVNALCHRYGYRNFKTKDNSTNNTFINIITLGSGLHNNHHADPMNYSNKVKNYEFDFPAWIIEKFLIEDKKL